MLSHLKSACKTSRRPVVIPDSLFVFCGFVILFWRWQVCVCVRARDCVCECVCLCVFAYVCIRVGDRFKKKIQIQKIKPED